MPGTTESAPWTIHRAIRALRVELGLTQKVLAGQLGLPTSYISLYERGYQAPPATVIATLIERLGIDPLWLETGEGACRPGAPAASPPLPLRPYRTLRPRGGELLAALVPPPTAPHSPVPLLREQVLRLRAVAELPTDDASFRGGIHKGWSPETAAQLAAGLESVAHKEMRAPGYVLAYLELITRLGVRDRALGLLLRECLRTLGRSPQGRGYLARHAHRTDDWQAVLLAQELTQLGHPYLGQSGAVIETLAGAGITTLGDLVGETPKSLAERTGVPRRGLKPLLDSVADLLARPQLPRAKKILAATPGGAGRRAWGYYRQRGRRPAP